MALKGYKIITVALTGGERGNPPDRTVKEYRAQKEREVREFAEMLGGEALVFPYVDGELPDNEEVRFQVCDVIRKYKPCAILTHWKNSIHKDHEATYRIVKDAHFFAGLASIERKDTAHFAKGPYYAQNWEDSTGFKPYVYVEVSEEGFALWQKAIQSHWFAVYSPSFSYMEYYTHLMKCNGHLIRKPYAEAFEMEDESKKIVLQDF